MRVVGWDVETHLIVPGCVAPKLVCVSAYDGEREYLFDATDGLAFMREQLLDPDVTLVAHHQYFDLTVLMAEDATLVPLVFAAMDAGRLRCTKIRQQMIDNANGELKFIENDEGDLKAQDFSLDKLVYRHFKEWLGKPQKGADCKGTFGSEVCKCPVPRLHYREMDGVPISAWGEAWTKYAISDSIYARRVFQSQDAQVQPEGIPGELGRHQAALGLYLMSAWGIRTEAEAVEFLRKKLTEDVARLSQMLLDRAIVEAVAFRLGLRSDWVDEALISREETLKGCQERGEPFPSMGLEETDEDRLHAARIALVRLERKKKPGEPAYIGITRNTKVIQARVEAWYVDAGRVVKLTDAGAICCERDVIMGTDDEGLHMLSEYVKLGKVLTTYVPALVRGAKFPINASYNAILETFRTSCSKPNIQNPPRAGGVRECFVPRPGSIFASCDYDTLELRSLAEVQYILFGYSVMGESLKEGRDLHLELAAEILGITYEEALERYNNGDKIVEDARAAAKPANFGYPGGMSWKTFQNTARKQYGIKLSDDMSQRLHKTFKSKWEMADYFNHASALAGGDVADRVVFVPSGMVRGKVNYCAIANGYFQHLAAMGATDALYAVVRECYLGVKPDGTPSPLAGSHPVAFLHDEIILEIPYTTPEAASASADRLAVVMRESMERWITRVPVKCGSVMMDRWKKGAKAARVDGVLLPSRVDVKFDEAGKKIVKWVPDEVALAKLGQAFYIQERRAA